MRRQRINTEGQKKSPSARKIIKLRKRAFNNGGASLELQIPTNYIRDISRKLNYDITSDASLIMVPNTIGEGRLFNCVPSGIRNTYLWSEDFSNIIWSPTQITITQNATTNPIGGSNAQKLCENNINAFHNTSQLKTGAGITSTLSVYMKASDRSWGGIQYGSSSYTLFDLTNGVKGIDVGTISSSITSVGSGWYRCQISATSVTNSNFAVFVSNSNSLASYTGTTGFGIYIWGAQLELGTFLTTYQRTTDGIIDFQATRATTANVTRKDGAIGDGCYNQVQFSEEFDNIYWSKSQTTITANVITAPNSTLTADKLVETAATGGHYVNRSILTTSSVYTMSVFFKAAERTWAAIGDGTAIAAYYDLQNGVLGSIIGSASATITPYSNGWYRCTLTGTPGSALFTMYIATANNTVSYTGNGTNGIYIWGAQLVQGSQPKDYLKTTNRLAVPSIDYSLGSNLPMVLIEPASTNLLIRSEEFDNVVYTKTNSSISANAVLSPNNTLSADKLIENNTNSAHTLEHTYDKTIIANSYYTASIFVKSAERSNCLLRVTDGGANIAQAIFNLNTNTYTTSGSFNNITANIRDKANGYKLITVTGQAIVSTSTGSFYFRLADNSGNITYLGDGVSGLYIWGAQLEQLPNPTSYIPTTTAAATRIAYTSFIDLYNNSMLNKDNFTLLIEGYLQDGTTNNISIALSDTVATGARGNDLGIFDGVKATYAVSGVVTSDTVGISNGSNFRMVIVRNGSSVNFFREGVQIWSTQTIAPFDYRYLVVNNAGSTFGIRKAMLWKYTKSDAECIAMTKTLNTNLIAYYKLDGNTNDSTGLSGNGVNNGGVTYGTGLLGQGANYNSANRYTSIADSDNFSMTSGGGVDLPFTVNIWINVNSETPFYLLEKLNSAYTLTEYSIGGSFPSSGNMELYLTLANSNFTAYIQGKSSTIPSSLNNWQMLTITYNGNKSHTGMSFYINGVKLTTSLAASVGTYLGMSNTTAPVTIGNDLSALTNRFFPGSIDELGVWKNRELTQSEVTYLYNSGLGRTYTFLQ